MKNNNGDDRVKKAEAYVENYLMKTIKNIYQTTGTSLYSKRMEKNRSVLRFIDENVGFLGLSKDEIKKAVNNVIKKAVWIKEIEELHEDYYEEPPEENETIIRTEIRAEDNLIPILRKIYENSKTSLKFKREQRQEVVREFIDECINEMGVNKDEIITAVDNVIKRAKATWIDEIEEMHEDYYEEIPEEEHEI